MYSPSLELFRCLQSAAPEVKIALGEGVLSPSRHHALGSEALEVGKKCTSNLGQGRKKDVGDRSVGGSESHR